MNAALANSIAIQQWRTRKIRPILGDRCHPWEITKSPHRFSQTYREADNGFKPLRICRVHTIAVGQKQLRVAENPSEWVVDFVPKNLGNVFGQFGP
jgi:hypothetical protein